MYTQIYLRAHTLSFASAAERGESGGEESDCEMDSSACEQGKWAQGNDTMRVSIVFMPHCT